MQRVSAVIFLTVGTHEPFDRLVRCVDEWCAKQVVDCEIFGQITKRAEYQPRHFKAVPSLDPVEYQKQFSAADFIVSHAGMGSIITALSVQKPIVILPRRGHLQETRNDHQFATAQRFKSRPGIFVAQDEAELPEILHRLADRLADGLADGFFSAGQEISHFDV
jgi:UDP-N-acetylglucosamine transferase subunit ALG13